MTWIPIGPDFVARFRNYPKRLSRWNEMGQNGWVGAIAIHPTNPDVICVLERPASQGRSVFRTTDGGRSWTPILDELLRGDPRIDPTCIALNPSDPDVVYLGTYMDRGFYIWRLEEDGPIWGPKTWVPSHLRKLVVDPTTAADGAGRTHIYAASRSGLLRSKDEGQHWENLLPVDCVDFAAHIPATGTKRFYVGAYQSGLWYTEDPDAYDEAPQEAWTYLNDPDRGKGLPEFKDAEDGVDSFRSMRVDFCAQNPARAYLWLVRPGGDGYVTEGIYTAPDPLGTWTRKSSTESLTPSPAYGDYCFEFAVAPNSPGDGEHDVLFIGNRAFHRSVDSGEHWTQAGLQFHVDLQAFAFAPADPPGTIPVLYCGDDGGISRATKLCDPAFDFGTDPREYGEGDDDTDNGWFENLNHGRQDVALYAHTSHPRLSALNYVGCQDTGIAGGPKALGWRSLNDGDSGAMAIAPGADGLKLWCQDNGQMRMYTETWDAASDVRVTVGPGGSFIDRGCNCVLTPDDECLTGGRHKRSNGTLLDAVTHRDEAQEVRLSDMTDIEVGSVLFVGKPCDPWTEPGCKREEQVVVLGVRDHSFRAVFKEDHDAETPVSRAEYVVLRAAKDGIATSVGSRFREIVKYVAAHPTNPNVIVCLTGDNPRTGDNNKVWRTNNAADNADSEWEEITTDRLADPDVVSLTITPFGEIYALLRTAVTPEEGTFATPLYRLDSGGWHAQACIDNPDSDDDLKYGVVVSHPRNRGDLFVAHGARVYRAVRRVTEDSGANWLWVDISDSLPGTLVFGLWAGWVGTSEATRQAVLRAAATTRGVWELLPDATPARDPELYVRDHLLDQGIGPLETGMPNPYDPSQILRRYYCADLKVEQIQSSASGDDYFQTDPAPDPLTIDHVTFDMLREDRSELRPGSPARVHVQVHNRSPIVAQDVQIWAIYARASAGVPGLDKLEDTDDRFDFWAQFTSSGEINAALPERSPWTAVGDPVSLPDISPARPAVASWPWEVPTPASGEAGHYCVVTFIHSGANPISETGVIVEYITETNRQIGQKNLHIMTVEDANGAADLDSERAAGGRAAGRLRAKLGTVGGGAPQPARRAYIEFHNPGPARRTANLEFDLRALPPELEVSIQPTPLEPSAAVVGMRGTRPASREEQQEVKSTNKPWWIRLWCWLRWLVWWVIWRIFGRKIGKLLCPSERALPRFGDVIYEGTSGRVVGFGRVDIAEGSFVAAMMRIQYRGGLPPGTGFNFEVRQSIKSVIHGGSGYRVFIAGDRTVPVRIDEDIVDVPGAGDETKFIPMAARHLVREYRIGE